MRKLCILFALVFTGTFACLAQQTPQIEKTEAFTIGKSVSFQSGILGESRTLNIYLPAGYEPDGEKAYPVIYLLDGSKDEDFIHIAGLVQFQSFSWINDVPESIVVGITNVDRRRDFTSPTNDKQYEKDFPNAGGSEKFMSFFENEVQPLVDKNFRTTSQRTIIGQSLGGLMATEFLIKNNHLFDNFLIVSPSLWWDNESLLSSSGITLPANKKVFICVGKEGEVMERVARQFFKAIAEENPEHKNLQFTFYEGFDHGDVLHRAAYDGLKWFFR